MSFSYTGLAFLLGSFAVGLLSYRFFRYWQREKTIISRLFLYMAGVFTLFMLITAVSGLFFAQNTTILKLTVIFAAFIQAFAFAVIAVASFSAWERIFLSSAFASLSRLFFKSSILLIESVSFLKKVFSNQMVMSLSMHRGHAQPRVILRI